MDIETLTADELADLINAATARLRQLRDEEKAEEEQRRERINDAITTLTALLGPEDAAPGVDSIRAVRQYDAETMGQNAGLALSLVFQGLELLTATQLDVANVVAAGR